MFIDTNNHTGEKKSEEIARQEAVEGANRSNDDLMIKISNFVDQVRLEADTGRKDSSSPQEQLTAHPKSSVTTPGFEDAQCRMEQTIIETEKFKASVEKPPGTFSNNKVISNQKQTESGKVGADLAGFKPRVFRLVEKLPQTQIVDGSQNFTLRQVIGSGISDDDFFHLTCHIDVALKKKIESGEFVDLDKLLPKENRAMSMSTNETKLEWVQSEESTYLVPAKNTS